MNRRQFLVGAGATAAGLGAVGMFGRSFAGSRPKAGDPAWEFTEKQWRKRLTPQQFRILRQGGTEPSRSSPLNVDEREGTYHCAACELPVYASETKFHSGTGWPSFYRPLPNAVATRTDRTLFISRTEVHCRRCAGHLGHVFKDGPPPTGLRYCMDGLALHFVPAADA